jgi:hypothetical protein
MIVLDIYETKEGFPSIEGALVSLRPFVVWHLFQTRPWRAKGRLAGLLIWSGGPVDEEENKVYRANAQAAALLPKTMNGDHGDK